MQQSTFKTRSAKQAGYTWGTTNLVVTNTSKTIKLYTQVFEFQVDKTIIDVCSTVTWAKLSYKDFSLHVFEAKAWGVDYKTPKAAGMKSPVTLYLYHENIENIVNQAKAHGLTILMEPEIMFWGDRMCKIEDPDGYIWDIAKNVSDFDASHYKMQPNFRLTSEKPLEKACNYSKSNI